MVFNFRLIWFGKGHTFWLQVWEEVKFSQSICRSLCSSKLLHFSEIGCGFLRFSLKRGQRLKIWAVPPDTGLRWISPHLGAVTYTHPSETAQG